MTLTRNSKIAVATVATCTTLLMTGCGVFKKELRTEIEIDSTPEKIWSTLMNFEEFPNWNPMIRKATGEAVPGGKLDVFIQAEGTKGMAFNPTVVKVDQNREFSWLGKVGMRGIFDGKHVFSIEPIDQNTTLFIHREEFSGVMTPLAMPFIADDTLRGFNEMNVALKQLVEQPE